MSSGNHTGAGTSRGRSPLPPQVLVPPPTAACTGYRSAPGPDLRQETVRKESPP